MNDVLDFIALTNRRQSAWCRFEHCAVYLRKVRRLLPDGKVYFCIDVANIKSDEEHQRSGQFWRLIRLLEARMDLRPAAICVENVANEHLDASLRRHGWLNYETFGPKVFSFYKVL